jgi:outer membrane protein TolC
MFLYLKYQSKKVLLISLISFFISNNSFKCFAESDNSQTNPDNKEITLKAEIIRDSKDISFLSLEEALKEAAQNNLELQIQDKAKTISGLDYQISKGLYAPILGAETFFQNQKTPVANLFANAPNGRLIEESWEVNPYLSGVLPFGTKYNLNFDNSRLRNNNNFQVLRPENASILTFSIAQPLLKGFWMNDNRRQVKTLKLNKDLADYNFQRKLQDTLYKTATTYWDLLLAYKNIDIKRESVDLANEQLNRTTRLAQIGSMPKIEIVSAEAELERRKEEVAQAQEQLFRTENSLKLLIAPSVDSFYWQKKVKPTEILKPEPNDISIEKALEASLMRRPEFFEIKKKLELKELDKKYYINRGLPQLDLIGSYSTQGLAGKPQVISNNTFGNGNSVRPRFQGDYIDNLENLASQDFNTIKIGLNMSWPISPQITTKTLKKVKLEKEQLDLEFMNLEQVVKADIANAFNAILTAQARIDSSTASLKASERQLNAEILKFKAGLSTNFLVLTRQNDLSLARLRLANAITDYNKAVSELEKASGLIVDKI